MIPHMLNKAITKIRIICSKYNASGSKFDVMSVNTFVY